MNEPIIKIYPDAATLAEAAARLLLARSNEVLQQADVFSIALSGGSTPKPLFQLLADKDREYCGQFAWDRTYFFFTDERFVPPDNADSNFRMVNEAMLSPMTVPQSNVHRIVTEDGNPERVAENYSRDLRSFFETQDMPRFDLILLGVGTDGHTASLFPGTNAVNETKKLATAVWVEKLKSFRISLTLPVLNNAKSVVFLVSGNEKAKIVDEVLHREDELYPAQKVKPTKGELIWMLDEAAAMFELE